MSDRSQDGKAVHVYDGIVEEDNHLPNWWLATLYGACVFALGYWIYYQAYGVGLSPLQAYQINYVKRVIGLPGEKVEFRDNRVYINDQLLPEHRITADSDDDVSALETTDVTERTPEEKWSVYYSKRRLSGRDYEFAVPGKTQIVPENHYFVMGDSRDNSEDSRYWGFVPRELIIGRAMFVYWSCDRAASNGSVAGCLTHPRLDRIFKFVQ